MTNKKPGPQIHIKATCDGCSLLTYNLNLGSGTGRFPKTYYCIASVYGRYIGPRTDTPSWCPYGQQAYRDNGINPECWGTKR
jgi:hypothetical protein